MTQRERKLNELEAGLLKAVSVAVRFRAELFEAGKLTDELRAMFEEGRESWIQAMQRMEEAKRDEA